MPIAVGTARYTRRASGLLLLRDGFDRASSTTALGRAETGQPWTVGNSTDSTLPTFGVNGNRAYMPVGGGTDPHAWVETNTPDIDLVCDIQVSTAASGGLDGILLRRLSVGNYYIVRLSNAADTLVILQNLAGARGTPFGPVSVTLADNQIVKLRVQARGPLVNIYADGLRVLTFTDTHFTTATKHGIVTSSTGSRFNDFLGVAA